MISSETLYRLRAAQSRAAHEQHLLSGRDWILVAAVVQLFAALPAALTLINRILLGPGLGENMHPRVSFSASVLLAVALAFLWRWARHAPFRASVVALIVFVAVHGALGFSDPDSLISGAVVKSLVLVGLLQAVRTGHLRHRPL